MAPIPKDEYCFRIGEELKSGGFWRDIVSEFVATFFFVCAVTALRLITESAVELGIGVAFAWIAIGYALGDFGGAHMNSAITMAMMIRAEISIVKAFFYWIIQTAAALAAFYTVAGSPESSGIPPGYAFKNAPDLWYYNMVTEFGVTFILCMAALATGNIPRKGYIILQSIPVGMAAGAGTMIAIHTTGACMSPTQALAHEIMRTILDQNPTWGTHWYFWVGPMIGAVLAAAFYWVFDVIDRPQAQNPYSTWTYADAKNRQNRSISKEPLTRDDDYNGRGSPPHHSHHGYNAY